MKTKVSTHLGLLFVALSLSPLFVNITASLVGFNFIEFYLFIGLLLLFGSDPSLKLIFTRQLKSKKFVTIVCALIVFGGIGLLTGESVAYVYSDFRAIFCFSFFSFLVLRNTHEIKVFTSFAEKVFLYVSIFELFALLIGGFSVENSRMITLAICPFFIAIISLRRAEYLKSLLFLIILCLQTTMSAMRINYLFIILYLSYLLFITFSKYYAFKGKIVFIFCICILTVALIPTVTTYLEANDSRYLHTVIRFENLFKKEVNEEETRKSTNLLLLQEPQEFIFPAGLGWRNQVEDIQSKFYAKYGVLSSMDSNFLYCIYHFGLLGGTALISVILFMLFRISEITSSSIPLSDKIIKLFFRVCIISMFILKSWIFVYFSFGFTYGILMLYALRPFKLEKFT